MGPIDLDGHTFFHDRERRREMANALALLVDLDTAVISVGTAGEGDRDELVFHEPAVRRALQELVNALRRHAYRRRSVQPVPRPIRLYCELCEGRREIRNPFSGEVFPCPACRR